eukprot:3642803-Prymnesium_polylepis.2
MQASEVLVEQGRVRTRIVQGARSVEECMCMPNYYAPASLTSITPEPGGYTDEGRSMKSCMRCPQGAVRRSPLAEPAAHA